MKPLERFKKIAVVLGIILAVHVLLAPLFLFFGHPVCYALVAARSHIFLWLEYPELDVRMDRISYDFVSGGYTAYFSAPNSVDIDCRLFCDGWGNIRNETAESATSKYKTLSRIDGDYKYAYQSAVEAADFSFRSHMNYADIISQHASRKSPLKKDFGISDADVQKLVLDGEYDFREFAARYGRITFHALDPEVTVERAAQILLELKAHLDRQNIPFYAIEFTLKNDNLDDRYIHVVDILYSEIREDGLVELINAYNDAVHDHYQKLDDAKK